VSPSAAASACPALNFFAQFWIMRRLMKELLLIIAIIAALAGLAWFSEPTESFLHTGQTCREIRELLAAKHYRDLTPAEETDMANCN
jgi:hypothetical protein